MAVPTHIKNKYTLVLAFVAYRWNCCDCWLYYIIYCGVSRKRKKQNNYFGAVAAHTPHHTPSLPFILNLKTPLHLDSAPSEMNGYGPTA